MGRASSSYGGCCGQDQRNRSGRTGAGRTRARGRGGSGSGFLGGAFGRFGSTGLTGFAGGFAWDGRDCFLPFSVAFRAAGSGGGVVFAGGRAGGFGGLCFGLATTGGGGGGAIGGIPPCRGELGAGGGPDDSGGGDARSGAGGGAWGLGGPAFSTSFSSPTAWRPHPGQRNGWVGRLSSWPHWLQR